MNLKISFLSYSTYFFNYFGGFSIYLGNFYNVPYQPFLFGFEYLNGYSYYTMLKIVLFA
jgi:hypothetical protein